MDNNSITTVDIINTTSIVIQTFCIIIQTVGVLIAGWLAWRAFKQTQTISDGQQAQTIKIHLEQKELTKNQTFISLFEHLKTMREIIPEDPCWEDVSDSANLLELMGIAWGRKLVSRKLIHIVYGALFVRVYEQIDNAVDKDTGENRGKVILQRDCKTAIKLYKKLKPLATASSSNTQPPTKNEDKP